jgi:dienelactone hydrolase
LLAVALVATAATVVAEEPPAADRRREVRTLDTPWTFVPPASAEAWRARSAFLREQVLVAAGLWPLPERTPLAPQVFGRIERGDYSVEKAYFESRPGFYVTGNLYRPLGRPGPFPGVLSPHGHWDYGRLENGAGASVPGRAISLARQGFVVFTYDMVGYDDSRQVDHRLLDPKLAQWGVGSLGLHLWNSIRALDFLETLPDVDGARLACTGASGGATQTFLLAAVDERVSVSAPVNMISHTMQGGDVCENAPNLRLDASNIELGALTAPRPMLMVAATGDWTRDTPRVEFPAVQGVYALLGARDKVGSVQFTADHNYNRDSREAVYRWFRRWLQGLSDEPVGEKEFRVEQPSDLLVFFGRRLPKEAKTQEQIVEGLLSEAKAQLEALRPRDAAGLQRFREVVGPLYRHTLAAEYPDASALLEQRLAGEDYVIGRSGVGDRVPVRLWQPRGKPTGRAVLLVDPDGIAGVEKHAAPLLSPLRAAGRLVASLDAFNTGSAKAERDTSGRFFTTYNRTDDANRAQDVLTAVAWLERQPGVQQVALVGLGRAGLWCLLAQALAPRLETVVADVDGFPTADDDAYLSRVVVPLFRKAGGFDTAITLGLDRPLRLHGTGEAFDTKRVTETAAALGAGKAVIASPFRLTDGAIAAWLLSFTPPPHSTSPKATRQKKRTKK